MMNPTHVVGGPTLWLGVSVPLSLPLWARLTGAVVAARFARWPDWDHPQSSIARSFGAVSYQFSRWVERRFGGHRAGTHSLLVGMPLCGAVAAVGGLVVAAVAVFGFGASGGLPWLLVPTFAAAGSVGALSHILLDVITCNCGGCDHSRPRRNPWNGRHLAGVEILWPWRKRRYGLPLLSVGGSAESVVARPVLWVLAGVAGVATISGW